ncbi:hypothetical protein K432DRAFT_416937 [Lepidopterella palustris CBS 459.81]|uniref:T6SS Phospholipase effector Tle1-like catalytic domain-containing protein n=1 Tax=Lepidopterella palustris CBS 459.81 TaxID=1314670 RepID=A0A8E2JFI0_9PEZI|nr:hypothetical protein K432DRAFT_416937 [Lepidopterella palustris CBS 459.81]
MDGAANTSSAHRSRAVGEPPFKRLIVACDGTWLNADNGLVNGKLSIPSNVTRISRAIQPVSRDGIPQVVYYHFGVGSQGSIVDRVVGGSTGEGLGENVREGYSFLATNYTPGDEIFLIGFSRGAFTARSIAGLIGQVGLLTKAGLGSLPEVFTDVQHRRDANYRPKNPNVPFPHKMSASDPRYREELARRHLSRLDIPIKAIGVWDTVGSLGTPRIGWLTKVGLQTDESKEMAFYDTKLSNCIDNAFQALALDERRSAFSPAVWEKPEGNSTTLRQVWFPGVHSNIGGGYDDQQLANITLAWMMSQLEPFLDMRLDYVLEQEEDNSKYYRKQHEADRPWSFGKIYNSMAGIYAIGGGTPRTPGTYYAVDPNTGRATSRPLRDTNEYIHPSARTRIRLGGPGVDDKGLYECKSLSDWKLVVDYDAASAAGGDPEVYWKARFKDMNVTTRVLPESPLWRLERQLAETDPETFEYIKKPPPSRGRGKAKGKRSSKTINKDKESRVADPKRESWGGEPKRERRVREMRREMRRESRIGDPNRESRARSVDRGSKLGNGPRASRGSRVGTPRMGYDNP